MAQAATTTRPFARADLARLLAHHLPEESAGYELTVHESDDTVQSHLFEATTTFTALHD